MSASQQPITDDKDQIEQNADSSFEEILNDIDEKIKISSKKTKLWLDLRYTNLSYVKALTVMEMEEFDTSLIDGIILHNSDLTEKNEFLSIVTPENNSWSSIRKQNAFKLSYSSEKTFVDPIPAMEYVSNGEWVLVDCTGVESTSKRDENIEGLTSLLVAATSSSGKSLMTLSIITEPNSLENTEHKSRGYDSKGGLAIICNSSEEVFKGFSLSETTCGSTELTNGILITADTIPSSSLEIALVLPLDFAIWKVAQSFLSNALDQ